ncbi:energy transducer TonB [Sphingorhabdus arenilitoris]|uniref:Energy transducer TonB n=1 Tax=Sphingorhabdus arenilitoris TaxID=1490041 RepID=A0ABV8RJ04_9SPHN
MTGGGDREDDLLKRSEINLPKYRAAKLCYKCSERTARHSGYHATLNVSPPPPSAPPKSVSAPPVPAPPPSNPASPNSPPAARVSTAAYSASSEDGRKNTSQARNPWADNAGQINEARAKYQRGGGYKTEEELYAERQASYSSSEPPKKLAGNDSPAGVSLFDWLIWLVTTKTGRNILFGAAVLFFILPSMCSRDEDNDERGDFRPVFESSKSQQSDGAPDGRRAGRGQETPTSFPSPSPPIVFMAQRAMPRGNISKWVTTNDYPAQALSEEREGVTAVRLDIGKNGEVTNCAITRSSGHEDLDQATCSSLRQRARFNPALDGAGNSLEDGWATRVRWQIPN